MKGMDLNPYRFTAPWTTYEFATHCQRTHTSLLHITMAWLTSSPLPCPPEQRNDPHLPTLGYWLERLTPLLETSTKTTSDEPDRDGEAECDVEHPPPEKEIIVALCNRAGNEGEAVHYAGTSAVLGIRPGGGEGEVRVYGVLGEGEEALLVVDTECLDEKAVRRVVWRGRGGDEAREEMES